MQITSYFKSSINDFSKMEASTPRLTLALKCSVVALSVLIGLVTLGIGGLIFFRAVVKSDPSQLTYAESKQRIVTVETKWTNLSRIYVEKEDEIKDLNAEVDQITQTLAVKNNLIDELRAEIAKKDETIEDLEQHVEVLERDKDGYQSAWAQQVSQNEMSKAYALAGIPYNM